MSQGPYQPPNPPNRYPPYSSAVPQSNYPQQGYQQYNNQAVQQSAYTMPGNQSYQQQGYPQVGQSNPYDGGGSGNYPSPIESTKRTDSSYAIPAKIPGSPVDDDELTEAERIEYGKGIITWGKAKDWRFWFRKEWTWYYVGFVIIIIVVALMAFFHHSIINWLTPFVRKLQSIKYGWLIPVAILFALSFPPLFGNEIVMVLVGLVWGLGVGFAIVAVGTILGEVANFFVFKYWCSARAHRMTKKSLNYACLSQAIQEGGFPMAFMVRLSAVPTHFTTVVFAVCGMKFWQYALALIAGLPKQLLAVYADNAPLLLGTTYTVGVILSEDEAGTTQTNSHVVSDCVFAATAVVTLFAMWFIYRRMVAVRKKVLIGMRDDLQSKHVNVGPLPTDPGFVNADNDDQRNWRSPFNEPAITAPHSQQQQQGGGWNR